MSYEELVSKIQNSWNEFEDFDFTEEDGIKVAYDSDWSSYGKYERLEIVFSDLEGKTFARVRLSRTGSYHTDYEVYLEGIEQVMPQKVVVTKYVPYNVEKLDS